METWEAIKLLQEGFKVRNIVWNNGSYIMLNKNGAIVDEEGFPYPIAKVGRNARWEIYEEEKEDDRIDADQVTKDLYKAVKAICSTRSSYDIYRRSDYAVDYINYILKLYTQLEHMNKYYKLDKE